MNVTTYWPAPLQAWIAMPATTEGGLIEVQFENGATLKSRSVILSTGARWRNMNVPGEQRLQGSQRHDTGIV